MKVDIVKVKDPKVAAVYFDGQLELTVSHSGGSLAALIADILGHQFKLHAVEGGPWEHADAIPLTLADALREGNLKAARPVNESEEL